MKSRYDIFASIRGREAGYGPPPANARSGLFAKVRKIHLREHQSCTACGGTEHLEVHHVESVRDCPERELDPDNLQTLCEAPGHNCHLVFGHLMNTDYTNPNSREDAAAYLAKRIAAKLVKARRRS